MTLIFVILTTSSPCTPTPSLAFNSRSGKLTSADSYSLGSGWIKVPLSFALSILKGVMHCASFHSALASTLTLTV